MAVLRSNKPKEDMDKNDAGSVNRESLPRLLSPRKARILEGVRRAHRLMTRVPRSATECGK
jgi:hypothetical protein